MQARMDIQKVAPQAYAPMAGLESYVRNSGLEPTLLELVKVRASQINGCAYCIDMHTKDARANGESEQRLYSLDAWRETPFFTDRERAALAWTEAITLISQTHAPDDVYEEVRQRFTDLELVNLTMAIVAINGWNRFMIGFRVVPGTYEPKKAHSAAHWALA
ncbi:MAG TPA: carboxymuconolactone decarboxylase family protein [Bryobacteraceae bacterium]|nr:carboxymuconolactone decarboxylase family protein [Bryobacteraceae bacterium]